MNFVKVSDLERYLIEEVGVPFRRTGKLEPVDLFLILHWKSRRSKTKIRDKLKRRAGSFRTATRKIAKSLHNAHSCEARLKILIREWGVPLPTATAILTILYPQDFTVYDMRVRKQLRFGQITVSHLEQNWDRVWASYIKFKQAVMRNAPRRLSLRDKDRYLWGKSVFEDAERDWRA